MYSITQCVQVEAENTLISYLIDCIVNSKMEKEKAIGYLLLSAGITVIVYAALSVFQVFSNQTQPYSLFAFEPISIDLSKAIDLPLPAKENASQELINSELLNKPMNIFAHVILMGFLVTVGYKIAGIGAMLIRPIKINLKESVSPHVEKNPNLPPWKS